MVRMSVAWGFALVLCAAGCTPDAKGGTAPSQRLSQSESPIVGGTPDTTSKGVVALTQNFDGEDFGYCSGSLLAPNLVLTARHCVSTILDEVEGGVDCEQTYFGSLLNFDNWSVSIQDDITDGAEPSLLFGMNHVVLPQGTGVCGADIALVVLSGQGIPGNLAQTFTPRLGDPPEPNDEMLAIGYGIQDPEDEYASTFGRRMRFDDGWVYCLGGSEECEGFAEEREFIADAPTCSGDSGGPAIDAQNRVMGVLSRGDDMCSVAIYTEVSAFAPLIRSTALSAAQDGAYPPPTWAGEPPDEPDAGTPEPDAGTTDGGGPDSGVTPPDGGAQQDGGSSEAGTPDVGGPTIDPLGLSCTGDCPGNYACYAATGQPPGICVPFCGDGLPGCPAHYACSKSLKACVPYEEEEGGCAIAPASRRATSDSAWMLISALLAFGLRRRR